MRDQATCHCRPESKVDLHAVEVPCGDVADALNKAFSRAIHDAWQQGYEQAVRDRNPRTITSVEELDALPNGSVILDADRATATRLDADYWEVAGYASHFRIDAITLPATVLYEPLP